MNPHVELPNGGSVSITEWAMNGEEQRRYDLVVQEPGDHEGQRIGWLDAAQVCEVIEEVGKLPTPPNYAGC